MIIKADLPQTLSTTRITEVARIAPQGYLDAWSYIQLSLNLRIDGKPLYIADRNGHTASVVFYAYTYQNPANRRYSINYGYYENAATPGSGSQHSVIINRVSADGSDLREVYRKNVFVPPPRHLEAAEFLAKEIDNALAWPHD